MSKPAFLILAHEDQPLLELLTGQLLQFGTVYIHLDTKSSIPESFLENRPNLHIYKEFSIRWGHWSMVEATMFLADKAVADGATYLSYLSGNTLPVCSKEEFQEFLDEEGDYFEANPITDEEFANRNRAFQHRFTHRYIAFKSRRNFAGRLQRRLMREAFALTPKLNYKKSLGDMTLCHGIGFWSVKATTYTRAIIEAHGRPSLMKYFKATEISDESFFQTAFRFITAPKANTARTYVDWIGSGTPAFITKDHLKAIQDSDYIFARKFRSGDGELLSVFQENWSQD